MNSYVKVLEIISGMTEIVKRITPVFLAIVFLLTAGWVLREVFLITYDSISYDMETDNIFVQYNNEPKSSVRIDSKALIMPDGLNNELIESVIQHRSRLRVSFAVISIGATMIFAGFVYILFGLTKIKFVKDYYFEAKSVLNTNLPGIALVFFGTTLIVLISLKFIV
ncbi:hypothetical protein [uncultured Croceitalea sp.]|uniref:hypothetical protein n=1 Tax=uncultured Croceitalea sp. TaxID=1798908 RepID=UPI00374F4DAD